MNFWVKWKIKNWSASRTIKTKYDWSITKWSASRTVKKQFHWYKIQLNYWINM